LILATHVHIWIGTSTKELEEYFDYFELDYKIDDINDPEYKVSQFANDIGQRHYNEEFVFHPAIKDELMDVGTLLESSLLDESEYDNVVNRCKELGITEANACFTYYTPDNEDINKVMKIRKPFEKSYNDLQYIGLYLAD